MPKYFVAKDGIQKGPWSVEEIIRHIQSKTLTWNDHVYDEKTGEWQFLFELPPLTDHFNQSFKKPVQKNKSIIHFDLFKDRVWYILKQDENYGPFTASEMIQMLQSKTLFEFDFIWRQDQEAWQRLADVPHFSPEKVKELFENLSGEQQEEQKTFFRRRFPRADYKCELLIHNNQKVFSAESIEISFGGASFKIDNVDFAVNEQVYLHFKPGNDVPAFNAVCKIVSRTGKKYGVSFVHISNLAKESIAKFTKKAA